MATPLQQIINKFKKDKKENPFTTSIRIDKKVYDKVFGYLNKNGVNFSDFINAYLENILEEIDELNKKDKESKS